MKRILAGAATAAMTLAVVLPAFADDHHDDRGNAHHHAPPPRRMAHHYREGQNWHGHRLAYRGGHWGYYQPRNGANVFISIPL